MHLLGTNPFLKHVGVFNVIQTTHHNLREIKLVFLRWELSKMLTRLRNLPLMSQRNVSDKGS